MITLGNLLMTKVQKGIQKVFLARLNNDSTGVNFEIVEEEKRNDKIC